MVRRRGKATRTRFSIRILAALSTAIFGVLVLSVVAALLWTVGTLQDSLAAALRDERSSAIASQIEVSLLSYQRMSNLYAMSGDADLLADRQTLAMDIKQLLDEAGRYVVDQEERRLLDRVEEQLERYFAARARIEAERPSVTELIGRTEPELAKTVAVLESLRRLNAQQVGRIADDARTIASATNYAALAAVVVLIAGLLLVVFGVRHYLLVPLLGLHRTMVRMQEGKATGPVPERGLREIRELSTTFNDMSAAVAARRETALTFLASVAHDLRNPMNALRLGIEALDKQESPVRRRRTKMMLDRQVERLARMVEDLLDATRIEAGKLELRRERVDLRSIATHIVELYAPTSPDHEVRLELADEPVWVDGDPLRLEQVAANLMSNAIKFSPANTAIDIVVHDDDGDAVLAVTDRGIGIAPEEVPRIFVPFRRRASPQAAGAGLGLSVVRHIVKAHGGDIEVDSALGQGSTFRVRLPLLEAAPAARAAPDRHEERPRV